LSRHFIGFHYITGRIKSCNDFMKRGYAAQLAKG
jgi:hypothetical protein